MDMIERVIREATAKTKDGRIDQADFLEYSQSSTRYSLFTPMEASIIFHFAGRGNGAQRLALVDFAQLLDPKWTPPAEQKSTGQPVVKNAHWLHELGHSAWNFALGGNWQRVCASAQYVNCVRQALLVPSERPWCIQLTSVSMMSHIFRVQLLICCYSEGKYYQRHCRRLVD
jgi:hypothetical protein